MTWLAALVAAPFEEWRHPRDRYGQFIEVGGEVDVSVQGDPMRATVLGFTEDGVRVRFHYPDSGTDPEQTVRSNRITVAEEAIARIPEGDSGAWATALRGRAAFDALYRAGNEWREDAEGGGLDDLGRSVAYEWKTGAWAEINRKLFNRSEPEDDGPDEGDGYDGYGWRDADSDGDDIDGTEYRSLSTFLEEADEVFEAQPPAPADLILTRSTRASHESIAAMLTGQPGDAFDFPGYLAMTGGDVADLRYTGIGGDVTLEILIPQGSTGLLVPDSMTASGVNGEIEVVLNRGRRLTLVAPPTPNKGGRGWTAQLVLD